MTTLPDPPPLVKRRRWRRLLLLAIPLAIVIAVWTYFYFASDVRLARALAETERQDPHWRLDDILAERGEIPDAENGALVVIAVKARKPPNWPAWDVTPSSVEIENGINLDDVLRDLKPNEHLRPRERDAMRPEMERAAPALQEARRLIDFRRGRFPIAYSRDFISTLLPNIQEARETAHLLQNDALFHAQSGDLDGALLACRALVNNARTIGDEPSLICQLVRMAIRAIAVGQTERTLGQGELPGADLARLQVALEEEAEEDLFRLAVRGERGGVDQLMRSLQDGTTSVKLMRGLMVGRPGQTRGWWPEEQLLHVPGVLTTNRAALLERMNQAVEIAGLPSEEQPPRFEVLKASLPREPLLVRELMPALEKVGSAHLRTQAQLRCAATGLAVERYRLKHGHWPASLADLVDDDLLRRLPKDPFDGQTLRYRTDGEGVIVYSIGPDRTDDGGNRATLNTHKPGTDLGFRLWDVDKRRQPRK